MTPMCSGKSKKIQGFNIKIKEFDIPLDGNDTKESGNAIPSRREGAVSHYSYQHGGQWMTPSPPPPHVLMEQ